MTMALRKTVATSAAFCAWAAGAPPRDFTVYHIGNLSRDRTSNPALNDLAETVAVLQRTGYVIGSQIPITLPTVTGMSYVATRTGGGWAPQSVLHSRLSAIQFVALCAVRDRDAAQSVTRSIRDALSCQERMSVILFNGLVVKGLVEEADGKGWQVSDSGKKMLL